MATNIDDDIDPDVVKALLADVAQDELESLSPEEGLEMYEQVREDDVTESTLDSHRSRLQFFIDWCRNNGIDNLNDVTGRHLQEFRVWRKTDLSESSLETNMRTLRIFLRKCVKFDAVRSDLPGKVDVPSVSSDENSRDEMVSAEQAKAILTHLDKYEYGSTEHVVWLLIAAAGLRVCSLRSLDVSDYNSTDEGGELHLNHRPESDTPLKNKGESERVVQLDEYASGVLEDYIDNYRPDVADGYGRSPLIASKRGRLHKTTMRKYAYKWTRPCAVSGECPHDIDPDECQAAQAANNAYQCPSSSSPHTIRRGHITHELNAGVPKPVVSDRCDVSEEIIDEHYDERSDHQKMELRTEIRESTYQDSEHDAYHR